MIKDLTINGVVYAKYDPNYYKFGKGILFLNVLQKDGKPMIDEDVAVYIIQLVENTTFKMVSYLNI